ncbi:MAG TPA: DUF5683 domain-containing protein [Candidatus Binatia bacterium]|nr:DUF5683 domain-containing protein [Candidatus Binatia bacterium]
MSNGTVEEKLSRKKAAWLPALLLAARLMLPAEGAAPLAGARPEKTPLRKALERSLLFPGLGQLGEKQYVKAALFAGGEIFCLVQVLVFMGKGNDAYRNYRDANDALAVTEFRSQTEKYDRQRNTAILAAAGIWALNMVDILVFAKKKYGRKTAIGFQPYYHHEKKTIGANLRIHY